MPHVPSFFHFSLFPSFSFSPPSLASPSLPSCLPLHRLVCLLLVDLRLSSARVFATHVTPSRRALHISRAVDIFMRSAKREKKTSTITVSLLDRLSTGDFLSKFRAGLPPGDNLPTWKSEPSDTQESHQNSNVPKSNSGLNGKKR